MKIIILFLISFSVFAGGRHDHDVEITNNYYETINNYYDVTEVTQVNEVSNDMSNDYIQGIALAIATNHPFDYVTNKWQGSVNASRYSGETGLSFGIAKRFKDIDALFHSTYGRSSNNQAVTAGAVWRF